MFRFEDSTYLWALAALPILTLFFFVAWRLRKQALARFGGEHIVRRLAPGLSRYKHIVKFSLLSVAFLLMIVALANPQWGSQRQAVKRKGIELMIALDISQSMLAKDVSPSRLEKAKHFSKGLVDKLKGNQIGLISFACNAYPSVPLTSDYHFIKQVVATANTRQAGAQGTSIGAAIDLAERTFDPESETHKAIIIITDGEDQDGLAASQAQAAHDNGTLIYTVGVGSREGGFIPVRKGGREDFLRDQGGTPVRTKLSSETLEEVARSGGGAYFKLANDPEELAAALLERIDTIEKREYEQRVFSSYESYFQPFIALALLFLIVEFILSYKSSTLRRSNRQNV